MVLSVSAFATVQDGERRVGAVEGEDAGVNNQTSGVVMVLWLVSVLIIGSFLLDHLHTARSYIPFVAWFVMVVCSAIFPRVFGD